ASQRIFPELDEFGFPETSGDFLPDPEFLDGLEGLPTPEYFEELDAIEIPDPPENPTEVVDAPEIMPDGMVSDPEHMIFIPDEIAFSQDAESQSHSESVSDFPANPDSDQNQNQNQDSDSEKPKRHILGKLIGVLAGAACIAGIVIAFRNGAFDEKEIYYMPDLTGENYMEFQNDLQLDLQIDNAEYSAYEKDRIYHQDIPAGEEIKPGQTVHIDVSLGLATAVVPDVRNYQLAYARKTLEQTGFQTEIQYEMSQGGTESGNVIRTEPAIGQEITIDQPVILYISQGSDNQAALVPDVVGMDLEAARILCEEAGLSVETEAVPSLESENIVVAQSLSKNMQVDFDTIIMLSYSNSEQPEGTINYQLQFPPYANGRFVLDFIDEEGTVIASSTVVAGFSAGSDIPVPGHGLHAIRVVLNNEATAEQETIGTYQFDFTTGTYEIITEDIQAAFEAVNGIG
ncbi:MAG: PASTA domain-containing protein, partial [Oscillospiraceae bacterium]|nr:PASTA domain-containing protein [Oscillospiraceae bacterium]